jgi:hypothetical protein
LSRNDSAIYFGNRSYSLAEASKLLSRQLDEAFFLSDVYNKIDKYNRSLSYLQQAVKLQDSVKGHEKIKAALILSLNEKLRQEEIAEQKLRDKNARFQQLQLSIIAICIPALFLITLLISRIKIHRRVVTFMGIISLLFLFEFLTLLLHPVVSGFTHDIPIFELLVFVSIAALLVPVHHTLEDVLINKLTKRNGSRSRIRITTKKMFLKKK